MLVFSLKKHYKITRHIFQRPNFLVLIYPYITLMIQHFRPDLCHIIEVIDACNGGTNDVICLGIKELMMDSLMG